jgi:hypothetical protein
MTDTEKIADVVVAAVRVSTKAMADDMAGLVARMTTLEASHTAMMGSMATMSDRMQSCESDMAACKSRLTQMETAMAAMGKQCEGIETKVLALASRNQDLSADEIALAMTDLLRKELAIDPLRMQKRIVRDADGKIDRVIDEVVTES